MTVISKRKVKNIVVDLAVLALAFYAAYAIGLIKTDSSRPLAVFVIFILTPATLLVGGYMVSHRYFERFGSSPTPVRLREGIKGALSKLENDEAIEEDSRVIEIRIIQAFTKPFRLPSAAVWRTPNFLLDCIKKGSKHAALGIGRLLIFTVTFALHFLLWCIPAFLFADIVVGFEDSTVRELLEIIFTDWSQLFALIVTFTLYEGLHLIAVIAIVFICALSSMICLWSLKRQYSDTESDKKKASFHLMIFLGLTLVFMYLGMKWLLSPLVAQ